VSNWVVQELANKLVDSAVKSCREQQALSFFWSLRQNVCDVLEESKLSHVVGFVKNSDFDCIEINVSRFHEVNESTWACNNDVNTIAHCFDLLRIPDAAINGGGTHTEPLSEWRQNIAHLVCELTSRDKNQCTWRETLTLFSTGFKTGKKRQGESKCLA
jgi:hypothetical protein